MLSNNRNILGGFNMSSELYFNSALSAYGNLKRMIWDNMTSNESRIPSGYTVDKITHIIVDSYLDPNTKHVLENKVFDPMEDYERHYHYLNDISVYDVRHKLRHYNVLRMTPLTSKANRLKNLLNELNDLSRHRIHTDDVYDDFGSAEIVLRDIEETINDDLLEIIENIKHTKEEIWWR